MFAGLGPKCPKHRKLLGEKPSRKTVLSLSQKQPLFKKRWPGPCSPRYRNNCRPGKLQGGRIRSCAECVSFFPHPCFTRKALEEAFSKQHCTLLEPAANFCPTAPQPVPLRLAAQVSPSPPAPAASLCWVCVPGTTDSSSSLS